MVRFKNKSSSSVKALACKNLSINKKVIELQTLENISTREALDRIVANAEEVLR